MVKAAILFLKNRKGARHSHIACAHDRNLNSKLMSEARRDKRYNKEIPYSVEVVTEDFFEDSKIIKIRSVILVERETQKGIIIGHRGVALKQVGIGARKSLQDFFGKKIHLELYVKVSKNWRSSVKQLKRFGYNS